MTTATPTVQRSSKPAKIAKLHQHPDTGAIHALSSDGHTVYVVHIGVNASCTCPAGRRGVRCYHLTTAEQRFAGFGKKPAAIIIPATEPEPEPPSPAAARRPCACLLDGPQPDCRVCRPAAIAA